MTTAPIAYRWDGERMDPLPRFRKECDARYVVGGTYSLDDVQDRSSASHAHYFACISDSWHNLPDDVAQQWPTPEHLRKWALIKAGFCDERSIVSSSKAEAQRIAAFIKPMDEYAVVTVSQAVVKVFTAQSQSYRAMGKADFQASKDAVLEILAGMLGTSVEALARNAKEAA